MKSEVLTKLKSSDYTVASNALNKIIERGKIKKDDLVSILSTDNTLIISDLLEKYKGFTIQDLEILEKYINKNLGHFDRLFVSDLIEFASSWGLNIDYDKCLSFLNLKATEPDNDYIILSSIDYVFENLKMIRIREIYNSLFSILHNPKLNQSVQIKAAFVLFRITGKKEFFNDLVDLVVNGHENNKELMRNILLLEHNNFKYFDYYEILKIISSG